MTIFAAYTSVADILPAALALEGTSASYMSSNTKEAMTRATSGGGGDLPFNLPSTLTDFWFASDVFPRSIGTGLTWNWLSFYDNTYSTTQPLFKFVPQVATGDTFRIQMWTGSAWVNITDAFTFAINVMHRMDVRIKFANTGGIVQLWDNGALIATNTIDNTLISGVTGINRVDLGVFGPGVNATYWSRTFIADEDTRAMQMVQVLPTGNGANTAWSGSYTDVDELGYSDVDVSVATASGQNETYTHGTLPAAFATGYEVKAVVLAGRMSKGQGHSMDIKGLFRIGSTNYIGASFGAGIGPSGKQIIYPVSPATGLPWTYTEAASEFGVACV